MDIAAILVTFMLITRISGDDLVVCPSNCSCAADTSSINCTGIESIPNFEHKTLIHSLTFSRHKIHELKVGDFENFTRLEHLDLSDGTITSIAAGAFDTIRTTVTRINLKGNKLTEVNSGVFSGLSYVQNIDLDSNFLKTIKANTFVNLTLLNLLTIRNNHLEDVDKSAFIGLPQLEDLNFYNNHLTQLPFEAIKNLTSLKTLTLTANEITSIPANPNVFLPQLEELELDSNPLTLTVFPNISSSLKRLDLMFTKMSSATKETWKNLKVLDELFLSGSEFQAITLGTFEGLTSIKTLLMRDMPVLSSIGPDAFNGLTNLEKVDLSSNKMLIAIDETAFMSTNVTSCALSKSSLSYIPESLFKWSLMKYVSVAENPINCDCKMKWMTNSSIFGNNTNVKSSIDAAACASPQSLAGRKVTTLNPAYFTCVSMEEDHSKRFVTGIVVAVICFVFMVTFALLMKNRKRISIACRRYYQYRRYRDDMVFTVEHDTSIAELEDTDCMDGRPLQDLKLITKPLDV